MRSWIEGGFKDCKRGGWGWHQTKMVDPARAERLWLAIAVATLWVVSVGGEVDATLKAEQFAGLAPGTRGSSHRHPTFAPAHAQLFCAGHRHDCRDADPR